VLDRSVNIVTGFTQFVTNVLGELSFVVTLTSGFPELDRVRTFVPTELARMLLTTTGPGKVTVPTGPLLVI
jgi:hypothetical protein